MDFHVRGTTNSTGLLLERTSWTNNENANMISM